MNTSKITKATIKTVKIINKVNQVLRKRLKEELPYMVVKKGDKI